MQQKSSQVFPLSLSRTLPRSIVNCPTSCHYPLSWRQACAHACCAITHGGTHCFVTRHRLIFNFSLSLVFCLVPCLPLKKDSIINIADAGKKAKNREQKPKKKLATMLFYCSDRDRLSVFISARPLIHRFRRMIGTNSRSSSNNES